MRGYWARIFIGAVVIFGVGYTGYLGVSHLVAKGRHLVESADPVTIPLKFVPFALAGTEVGTFQRVTFRRSSPQSVTGIDLRVKISDSALAESLRGCRLSPASTGDFDPSDGFRCLEPEASDSGFTVLGDVRVRGPAEIDFTIPLLIEDALFAKITGSGSAIENTRVMLRADEAAAAAVVAEVAATRATQKAESLSTAIRARVKTDQAPPSP